MVSKLQDRAIALFIAKVLPIISGRHSDCFTSYFIWFKDTTTALPNLYQEHFSIMLKFHDEKEGSVVYM